MSNVTKDHLDRDTVYAALKGRVGGGQGRKGKDGGKGRRGQSQGGQDGDVSGKGDGRFILENTGVIGRPPILVRKATADHMRRIATESDNRDETQDELSRARKNPVSDDKSSMVIQKNNRTVWNLPNYSDMRLDRSAADFIPTPGTVNQNLWKNAQLNMQTGVYKVAEGIYQCRNYDLSNVSFIKTTMGWIVVDPLTVVECSFTAFSDLQASVGGDNPYTNEEVKKIAAVVYTHSHEDHFGGVKGLFINAVDQDISEAVIPPGLRVFAPDGFFEHAVSENVIAGNAMGRRAMYQFGSQLVGGRTGHCGAGLGMTTPAGVASIIPPTDGDVITDDNVDDDHTIGEVKMEFQLTPGTEAPAEMNLWFPDILVDTSVTPPTTGALLMAENTTENLHNILTLRGAQIRDSLSWAKDIQKSIDKYGAMAQVKFQSHHWPTWGNAKILRYLKMQRDCYKYLHDQTVRLMNRGYVGSEIAEMIRFPPALESDWSTKGFYGTLRHNSRGVYQYYMGWYDGNPSSLDVLPPTSVSKWYIAYMGGPAGGTPDIQSIVNRVSNDISENIDNGFEADAYERYRWAAEVLKHVIFYFDEKSVSDVLVQAKELLADVYTQLGYMAESGVWRSIYLQGAYELINGVTDLHAISATQPDILNGMTLPMLFDSIAVRVNADWSTDKDPWTLLLKFSDVTPTEDEKTQYLWFYSNQALSYTDSIPSVPIDDDASDSDGTVTMTKVQMAAISNAAAEFTDWEDISFSSAKARVMFETFVNSLDDPKFSFAISTPGDPLENILS